MNQFAKEIQEDLNKMCEKYQIQKGIFLFEEKLIENPKQLHHRVIIFKPNIKSAGLNICEFAQLLNDCLAYSKTFLKIAMHMNEHAIDDIAHDLVVESELTKKHKPID